jgi:hypothetical protein
MKKTLMTLCAAFLMTGCATTTTKKELHPDLTMDGLEKNCKPDEFWNVQVLTTPAIVLKFPECMKYKSLLVVSVPNTADTKKIRELAAELLIEQYLSYLERTNEDMVWTAENIKTAVEKEWRTRYLLLSSKSKKPVE